MLDGISADALEEDPGYVSVRFQDDTGELVRRRLSVFEVAIFMRELRDARDAAQYLRESGRQRRKYAARRRAQLEFGRGAA